MRKTKLAIGLCAFSIAGLLSSTLSVYGADKTYTLSLNDKKICSNIADISIKNNFNSDELVRYLESIDLKDCPALDWILENCPNINIGDNNNNPDDNGSEGNGSGDNDGNNTPGNNGSDNNTPGDDGSGDNNSSEDSLSQLSAYAKEVADLVNAERAKAGLNPLEFDVQISGAAQTRAEEIVTSFSHTRPNGSSFSSALNEHGISYRGAGENIAWGQKSPAEVMNGWMNSDGHRANILNQNYTKIGVGVHQTSNGTLYWTQLFVY